MDEKLEIEVFKVLARKNSVPATRHNEYIVGTQIDSMLCKLSLEIIERSMPEKSAPLINWYN